MLFPQYCLHLLCYTSLGISDSWFNFSLSFITVPCCKSAPCNLLPWQFPAQGEMPRSVRSKEWLASNSLLKHLLFRAHTQRLIARGRQTKWNPLQQLCWRDAGVAAVPLTSEGRGWWPVARTGQRQPDTLNCAQAASSCDGPASGEAWWRTVKTHSHDSIKQLFHNNIITITIIWRNGTGYWTPLVVRQESTVYYQQEQRRNWLMWL